MYELKIYLPDGLFHKSYHDNVKDANECIKKIKQCDSGFFTITDTDGIDNLISLDKVIMIVINKTK